MRGAGKKNHCIYFGVEQRKTCNIKVKYATILEILKIV